MVLLLHRENCSTFEGRPTRIAQSEFEHFAARHGIIPGNGRSQSPPDLTLWNWARENLSTGNFKDAAEAMHLAPWLLRWFLFAKEKKLGVLKPIVSEGSSTVVLEDEKGRPKDEATLWSGVHEFQVYHGKGQSTYVAVGSYCYDVTDADRPEVMGVIRQTILDRDEVVYLEDMPVGLQSDIEFAQRYIPRLNLWFARLKYTHSTHGLLAPPSISEALVQVLESLGGSWPEVGRNPLLFERVVARVRGYVIGHLALLYEPTPVQQRVLLEAIHSIGDRAPKILLVAPSIDHVLSERFFFEEEHPLAARLDIETRAFSIPMMLGGTEK